eukprot:CAMPEP_0174242230 /NCGR_PEP_ID=MMETSP0417-20130205/26940_1 /TAXON_ID=242541 /ORGANISM="Mayorella sp, Strain BSH-02190019" /LENGTH=102 /DNA_ID=CAMNT_0015321595 /DNA_START=96 /DNA_END=400 /DNA_ORIENTATION=-
MASLPEAVHCGWITKRGARRKSWKRRWFVLDKKAILSYYVTESARIQKGKLDLCQMLRMGEVKKKTPASPGGTIRFEIVMPTRTYLFVADSVEAHNWMEAIR